MGISEKTLYNYITAGVFSVNGLIDLDLRMKTSRKNIKKQIYARPRKNRAYLKGRTYSCFEKYRDEHPGASIVEMDTVYNGGGQGPFIQTFQFVDYDLMVAFLHHEKTAEAMASGVRQLKERLGDSFLDLASIILTDRGTEFTNADAMEELGCHLFYCDPMCCSCQKPTALGLRSQEDLDLIFSHINSYPRKSLKGKSAVDLLCFIKENRSCSAFI